MSSETPFFPSFGEALKAARKRRQLTQKQLAQKLGVHYNTISSWELGTYLPETRGLVLEIARHLQLDEQETRELLEASLTALSPRWNIPYQRNPFFTGREDILRQLHASLSHEHSTSPCQSYVLSGLTGVGKTQTAIEYAYRYVNDYSAVFWVGAQTYESLISSFVAIADLLNLPEKRNQEQSWVITAVIHWFNYHDQWLLIFDNVDDIALVKGFLPSARRGSLLFTSRMQAFELTAQMLNLEPMTPEEGIHFLLHRARLLDATTSLDCLAAKDRAIAQKIVSAMEGLPLALDQAGSYIEATRCSPSDYLHLYRSSQLRLLDERNAYADHPLSVARTFTVAFEQLERENSTARELLTVCAFLAPEAIPEAFFYRGATRLGPAFEALAADPFAFDTAIKALLAYSLLQRNAETHEVTIHRLVQVVLKGSLSKLVLRMWAWRIVCAMSYVFPSDEMTQADYWQDCERLLPHALACIALSEQEGEDGAQCVISLMRHVAIYLLACARYTEAEPLLQRVLRIREQVLGAEHLQVAEVLNGLASLYLRQGKYEQAEPLYQRALRIREQVLGTEHPQVATLLNNLAELYRGQGRYEQAEPLFLRALQIWEQDLGSDHPRVAYPLNNLAELYRGQGRYEQAEPLFLRALQIWEQTMGIEHFLVADALNGLALLYKEQRKYEQAESLFWRALRIREQALGPQHPYVIMSLNELVMLYKAQEKYEQADLLYWLVFANQRTDTESIVL
ncbi:MAG TPA: FxSxx-COOH system tetratricopeptide repeat protein [Ktedonobacteraceae bacterium]|nr:FxSxx-COOH system tetratricopeptide repeat protein [Ktedonobacteraceae bacterium]